MNVLMIILLIGSILLTLTGASKKNVRLLIGGCLSYALSLLAVVGDVLIRLNKGDSAGVMDIYPTMIVMYFVVFLVIGITCFVVARRNR